MGFVTRVEKQLWKLTVGEDRWIDRRGDFRTRERYGRVSRANYAYGMLRAADVAKYFGHKATTVMEFGVASGAGLLNMIEVASQIERETGIHFNIVGFDTGKGLPSVEGYKDHPEIWNVGDFYTEDRNRLLAAIAGRAEIVWGDIAMTVSSFVESLKAEAPLGFVSIDVDIYSGTVSALKCLEGTAENYLPAISMYFDDVNFFFANEWCGELAAINEFNDQKELRKISPDRSVGAFRPKSETWFSKMFVCHILDHPDRQKPRDRRALAISDHVAFTRSQGL